MVPAGQIQAQISRRLTMCRFCDRKKFTSLLDNTATTWSHFKGNVQVENNRNLQRVSNKNNGTRTKLKQ